MVTLSMLTWYSSLGSPTFDEFLAERSQFDSDHGVDFYAPTIRDLCATAFCVLLSFVFYEKIIKKCGIFDDAMFTLRD